MLQPTEAEAVKRGHGFFRFLGRYRPYVLELRPVRER
jgi:hypothetical protein